MLPIHHLSFNVSWFVVYICDGDRVGLVIGYIKNFLPLVADNNSILYQMNTFLLFGSSLSSYLFGALSILQNFVLFPFSTLTRPPDTLQQYYHTKNQINQTKDFHLSKS